MTELLSPQVFAILSALVEERIGLAFAPADRKSFGDKIAPLVADAGFSTALDYYYALRYDDEDGSLFAGLVDALVVGETYFFRESEPLLAAIEHVLRPAVLARGRARVWSAACSTGEEPLTMAMLLERAGLADAVTVVASDVSKRSVARAMRASYGARSMRAVLDPALHVGLPHDVVRGLADRWIEPRDGTYEVRRELVSRVTFHQQNLLDDARVAAAGPYDLVVCRNVFIYFADATVRRVVASMASALAPGGRVLVGASESLMRFGTMLECEERGGAFLYGRGGEMR